jgi:hypothetical protein
MGNVFSLAKTVLFTKFKQKPVCGENARLLGWDHDSHDFERCPLCQLQILSE